MLRAVYAVSKQLQSKSVNLSASVAILGGTVAFVSKLRQSFHDICISSESMAKKLCFQIRFNETQSWAKKLFHEELASDYPLEAPRDQFIVNVFLPVVDVCLSQLKIRFESLQEVPVVDVISFLFPVEMCNPSH